MTAEFQPPPTDMVRVVRNIIESYKMGPLRALAQDPVQNALDARNGSGSARVDYRLLERELQDGRQMSLLTVTDQGTTGLRGRALSYADLHDRAARTGYLELAQDENWAAWEAMGYTKSGEDKLGSRGQGKAAFLYHSRRPLNLKGPGGSPLEGMVMMYDTLLADGTYRLGVRLAQPADLVRYPPFVGEEAREIIATQWASPNNDLVIPLGLEPLTVTGARIIVPFLSDEAKAAFRDGEMNRWLERCWWRAIQIGRLEINVTVDDTTTAISVPSWWKSEPWNANPRPGNVFALEDVEIEAWSGRRIKRIVLLYDASLKRDEVEDVATPQYAGVQLLRGQQWIETIGTKEFDEIPVDAREGFRGFVEFDRDLEFELREVESPQHDAFHRRRPFVRQIALVVDQAVEAFAEQQGWVSGEAPPPKEDRTAEEILRQVTEVFISGGAVNGHGDRDLWTAQLDLGYPNAGTTRVDWGESIDLISASCSHVPSTERREVRLDLVMVDPMGDKQLLYSRTAVTRDGSGGVDFPNVRIVKVPTGTNEAVCEMLGRYRLRVECYVEDERVATSSRNVYVRMDPPDAPPPRPIGVEVTARNVDSGRTRINDGEHLDITITIKNRGPLPGRVSVVASLEELLLHDERTVNLPGRLAGDQPPVEVLVTPGVEVTTLGQTDSVQNRVRLDPGPHAIRVDVLAEDGEVVASGSKTIWVEQDPDDGGPDLPFDMHPRESLVTPYPVWVLEAPHGGESRWVVLYATTHPSFKAALLADQAPNPDGGLSGRRLFFGEMVCSALIEWALSLYREHGDESGLQTLVERAGATTGPLWERYRTTLEKLVEHSGDPLETVRQGRDAVSLMLYVLQGDHELV